MNHKRLQLILKDFKNGFNDPLEYPIEYKEGMKELRDEIGELKNDKWNNKNDIR